MLITNHTQTPLFIKDTQILPGVPIHFPDDNLVITYDRAGQYIAYPGINIRGVKELHKLDLYTQQPTGVSPRAHPVTRDWNATCFNIHNLRRSTIHVVGDTLEPILPGEIKLISAGDVSVFAGRVPLLRRVNNQVRGDAQICNNTLIFGQRVSWKNNAYFS